MPKKKKSRVRKAMESRDKLHPTDETDVRARSSRKYGKFSDRTMAAMKEVAGKPGSYTTKPGGRIRNSGDDPLMKY